MESGASKESHFISCVSHISGQLVIIKNFAAWKPSLRNVLPPGAVDNGWPEIQQIEDKKAGRFQDASDLCVGALSIQKRKSAP